MPPPSSIALNAARVPAWLRALIVLPALGGAAYFCVAYRGPYRWLAEWQLDAFGSYQVVLTIALTTLVVLAPAAIAIQLLGRLWSSRAVDGVEVAARQARTEAWLQGHFGYLLGALFVVGLLGTAAFFALDALTAGARTRVDVAELERGGEPPSRYAELTGQARLSERLTVETSTKGSPLVEHFIPISSSPDRDVHVFVAVNDYNLRDATRELQRGPIVGVLSPFGLPGPAVTEWSRRGHLLPERYWVLEHGDSPSSSWTAAGAFAFCGGVALAITAGVWLLRRKKRALH